MPKGAWCEAAAARGVLVAGALLLLGASPATAWSILDEVTVLDPMLTAQMDFEMPAAKSYCDSLPKNLDRLSCEIRQAEDFWFGTDAAGNRYGVITVTDPNGIWFDVMRRPPGTQISEPVLRITNRVEHVFGEVIKLQASGQWTVDVSNGEMTLSFRGQCFTSACVGQSDTGEHYGTLRVSGLPGLFEIAASYQPPGTISFRLPATPEGLPTGSTVDLYAGPLGTLPDLSFAQPLACDTAAGLSPGDLVSASDTLADPSPGEGRYYLLAVTQGTERRAGRRTEMGILVGRDVTGLPICSGL